MLERINNIGAAVDAFMCKHWFEVCGVLIVFALIFFSVALIVE